MKEELTKFERISIGNKQCWKCIFLLDCHPDYFNTGCMNINSYKCPYTQGELESSITEENKLQLKEIK